jgi:hypothetical protein
MSCIKTLAAALTATALGTVAFAEVDKIAKVDVTTDLTAIKDEKAVAYWGNLEKDLEAAIGARVGDLMADEGAEILVDIREVELANAFERELNLGDAVLVGQVNVNDQTDNSNYDAYELSPYRAGRGRGSAAEHFGHGRDLPQAGRYLRRGSGVAAEVS